MLRVIVLGVAAGGGVPTPNVVEAMGMRDFIPAAAHWR